MLLEQELCVAQEELDCMARNGQIFFKNTNLNPEFWKKSKNGEKGKDLIGFISGKVSRQISYKILSTMVIEILYKKNKNICSLKLGLIQDLDMRLRGMSWH